MKVQPAVKKETLHIAAGTGLLTAVMLLVFLLLGRLTLPVVLGLSLIHIWASSAEEPPKE